MVALDRGLVKGPTYTVSNNGSTCI